MKGLNQISSISVIFFLVCVSGISFGQKWHEEKYYHRLKELDAETYNKVANDGTRVNFESLLDPMLIPRVSGTDNNVVVRNYIMNHMKNLGWAVETDEFEDDTPFGRKPFANIMATLNPNTARRLVLACHYDSKYTREYDFIGATDSAVPCAMLLHLAQTMKDQLNEHKNYAHNVTLQFVFFDGEEAFQFWSSTDSIYGARHLAAKWQQESYPANNPDKTTMLHRMDMMVLLDLLGTSGIKLSSYFDETSHWHDALVKTEQQLKRSNFWSGSSRSSIFQARPQYGGIEDDHIPFLQRGVDILHVIPTPFPKVWHTAQDNKDALDFPTIDNLNKIFRLFVARYLWGTLGPTPTSTLSTIRPPKPMTSSSNSVSPSVRPGPLQSLVNFFKLLGQRVNGNSRSFII